MALSKEEKQQMLEEILQHREQIFEHLRAIENLVKCIGTGIDATRMQAYWLPSIKGALGDDMYPNTIMISMGDTIRDLEDALRGQDIEEVERWTQKRASSMKRIEEKQSS